MEIKAKVEKDDMKLKGIGTTTVVKTKKEETACVIKVTVATIFATNTSIKMDKAMVDVVKTPGGRKETHEAEVHETTVAVSADPKIKGVNPIATMDKSKAKNC